MPFPRGGLRPGVRATGAESAPGSEPTVPVRPDDADRLLRNADLSAWFDPFLPRFAREAVRSGGVAVVEMEGPRPAGLLLTDPIDRVASAFTRSRAVAERLARAAGGLPVYSEIELPGVAETFHIYVASLAQEPRHRFRHPVRLLTTKDSSRLGELIREVHGVAAEPWLEIAEDEGERCLGVEVDRRLVGLAWVLVAGETARLHGLAVRAEFRRLGIGTDLVVARLTYAFRRGARRALTEIADRNVASRATAERAGLRPAGRLFLVAPSPSASTPEGTGVPPSGPSPTFA